MTDLIGGRGAAHFQHHAAGAAARKIGKLRALGVTTAKRAAAAPEVPTIAESGVKGFNVSNWQGILLPGKPGAIVRKLNRDLLADAQAAGMPEALAAQGWSPPAARRGVWRVDQSRDREIYESGEGGRHPRRLIRAGCLIF